MSNQSPNTTMIAARVPNADLFALKAECEARGMKQTAAIIEAIRRWVRLPKEPPLVASILPLTVDAEARAVPKTVKKRKARRTAR